MNGLLCLCWGCPLNGKVCSSFTVQRYAFILFPPTENFYLSIEEIYEAPDFPLNTGILHRNVVLEKSEGTTSLLSLLRTARRSAPSSPSTKEKADGGHVDLRFYLRKGRFEANSIIFKPNSPLQIWSVEKKTVTLQPICPPRGRRLPMCDGELCNYIV